MASKILIVDDEPKIIEVVKAYLENEGFQVASAPNGQQALEQAAALKPDLIILDLNLPDKDGLEVCRSIRKSSNVPIIMLTGRGEEVDKIVGLEIGADDYVTKPFSAREIVARVRAVLRRQTVSAEAKSEALMVGQLVVDEERHEVSCQGLRLDLTTTEFKLLAILARSAGKVLTRMQLLDALQGVAYEAYERTIDTHVKNLRQKMESLKRGCGCGIETVRGIGYKLEIERHGH
jgi:DNA-binding response OmpR family regulator